ncbi:MAG: hypothetical protein JWQ19_1992 [Subtercola sp.]|nr:hypothetical protein [Subtercola sp.]
MPPKKAAGRGTAGTLAPTIDFVEPTPERLSAGDPEGLLAGDYREGELFEGADLSEYDLAGCSFLECRFDAVTLTEAELRGSRFIESVFVSTFAQSLKAARTTWRDVRFESPAGVRPNSSTANWIRFTCTAERSTTSTCAAPA